MTTLLDRYLADVRDALPPGVNAGDILAEIADDIQSRIDEGASESEAIAAYGNPAVVAARYRRVQYLIGPALFPYYLVTLRNVLVGTIALVLFGGGVAALAMHRSSLFYSALGIAWNSVAWVAIVVTLIFALRERADSFELPDPSRRSGALVEFIANMIALLVVIDAPSLAANLHLTFSPAWAGVYLATIAGSALVAGSAMTYFVQPRYERLHDVMRIIASVVTIGGLIYTLAAGPAIEPSSPWLAQSVLFTLLVATAALSLNVVLTIRSLAKQRDPILHTLERGDH